MDTYDSYSSKVNKSDSISYNPNHQNNNGKNNKKQNDNDGFEKVYGDKLKKAVVDDVKDDVKIYDGKAVKGKIGNHVIQANEITQEDAYINLMLSLEKLKNRIDGISDRLEKLSNELEREAENLSEISEYSSEVSENSKEDNVDVNESVDEIKSSSKKLKTENKRLNNIPDDSCPNDENDEKKMSVIDRLIKNPKAPMSINIAKVHQLVNESFEESLSEDTVADVKDYMHNLIGKKRSQMDELKWSQYSNALIEWTKIHNRKRLETCQTVKEFVDEFLKGNIYRSRIQNTAENVRVNMNLGNWNSDVDEVERKANEIQNAKLEQLGCDSYTRIYDKSVEEFANPAHVPFYGSQLKVRDVKRNNNFGANDYENCLDGLKIEYQWIPKYAVKLNKENGRRIIEMICYFEHETNIKFGRLVVKDKNGFEYEIDKKYEKAFMKLCPIFTSKNIEIHEGVNIGWDDFWWMQDKMGELLKDSGYMMIWKSRDWNYGTLWSKMFEIEIKRNEWKDRIEKLSREEKERKEDV